MRNASAATTIVLLALSVSGCAFFQMSPYSNAAGFIEQRAVLGGVALAETPGTSSRLEFTTDGTRSFIYLLQYPQDAVNHLVILDENMNVRYSGSNPGFGRFHSVDPSGAFTVGTMYFDPTAATINPQPIAFSGNPFGADQLGFLDASTTTFHMLSIGGTSGEMLSDNPYSYSPPPGKWSAPTNVSAQLSSTLGKFQHYQSSGGQIRRRNIARSERQCNNIHAPDPGNDSCRHTLHAAC